MQRYCAVTPHLTQDQPPPPRYGLVQLRLSGIEELRWVGVVEVIDTQMHALGGSR
jgi:hypothetical protein